MTNLPDRMTDLRAAYDAARKAERDAADALVADVRETFPGVRWDTITSGDGHVEARWKRNGWHWVALGFSANGWWATATYDPPPSSRSGGYRTVSVSGKRDSWNALLDLTTAVEDAGYRARSIDVTHDLSMLSSNLRNIACASPRAQRVVP